LMEAQPFPHVGTCLTPITEEITPQDPPRPVPQTVAPDPSQEQGTHPESTPHLGLEGGAVRGSGPHAEDTAEVEFAGVLAGGEETGDLPTNGMGEEDHGVIDRQPQYMFHRADLAGEILRRQLVITPGAGPGCQGV